ncbi:host attachment protein [Altererythrobacter sp. B11]|uniref:host attachment family protein n=1 Tax=Altererythrobacter sp. B11 TaxID=2060312 RepID=UPI000DC71662|nr:host attachment family protein [Altererythrobacter sp. B11]BBC73906.1 host attachment protein [Altererythrobacter sp. B11]
MQIAHNALIVVADGRKMLMLRNRGNPQEISLEVVRKEIHESPKDSEQKTDAAGASSSTQSGRSAPPIARLGSNHARGEGAQFAPSRGSMEETDYHQMEEDRFAAEVADMLKDRALSNDFDDLVIVAPARTLGELRKHYHKEVEARLTGEIDKDFTGHPVPEIEQALARAE